MFNSENMSHSGFLNARENVPYLCGHSFQLTETLAFHQEQTHVSCPCIIHLFHLMAHRHSGSPATQTPATMPVAVSQHHRPWALPAAVMVTPGRWWWGGAANGQVEPPLQLNFPSIICIKFWCASALGVLMGGGVFLFAYTGCWKKTGWHDLGTGEPVYFWNIPHICGSPARQMEIVWWNLRVRLAILMLDCFSYWHSASENIGFFPMLEGVGGWVEAGKKIWSSIKAISNFPR